MQPRSKRSSGFDILAILASRIGALPAGDHTLGLTAVLAHARVAASHFERGRTQADDSAFADAIYRANLAFEGGLKEAYRVLAGKDPAKTTPFEIENYLKQRKILRQRVQIQLSRYRSEWRNPSTHDYRLDFDEDEALWAIVSVAALAIVLADQIAEALAFQAALARPVPIGAGEVTGTLGKRIAELLLRFNNQGPRDEQPRREWELVGAVHGFLETVLGDAKVYIDHPIDPEGTRGRADLLIETPDSRVIVELKRLPGKRLSLDGPITQMAGYLVGTGIQEGVLYIRTEPVELSVVHEQRLLTGGTVFIVGPGPRAAS